MLRFIRSFLMFFALAVGAAPLASSAAIIVDTGAPTGSIAWPLYRTTTPLAGQNLAARFDLATTTNLTDLEGFVSGLGSYTISIASNSTDQGLPLATLYSGQAISTSAPGAWSGLHGLNLHFTAGSYWLVFGVLPFTHDTGQGAALQETPADTLTGGFMLEGAPSPQPNEAYFQIPGFTWNHFNDFNIGVRITDDVQAVGAGVPEPATWALMIGGFCMAGSVLRRRRALTT